MVFFSRRQQVYITLTLLAIGPALIAVHPSIPFANGRSCDPWYVFGLFYHLPDAIHWTAINWAWESRQIARLTNVIPGYLLTKLFAGIAADYLLFFLLYSSSIIVFYRAVRTLVGDKVAVFAATFFALHPLIIGYYSTTFAAPAMFYCVLSFFMVAHAMQADRPLQRNLFLFGSGVAIGAALHAHLGVLVYGVGNYLIYSFHEILHSPKTMKDRIWRVVEACGFVFGGIAVLTAALGGLAMLLGGRFSLVFAQFLYLRYEFSDAAKQEWAVQGWYWHGGIGGMLVAALLISAINIYLCNSRRFAIPEEIRRFLSALSWSTLVLSVIYLLYGLSGGSIIQYEYYYVFFIPYFSIVIFLPLLFLKSEGSRVVIAAAAIFLIAGMAATGIDDDTFGSLHRIPNEAVVSIGVGTCAALIYAYLVVFDQRNPLVFGVYLVLPLILLLILRPEEIGAAVWQSDRDLEYARQYGRIRKGLAFLSTVHFNSYPRFWVDSENGPPELLAYPRSYLYCRFQSHFPGIEKDNGMPRLQFGPRDDVVIISRLPHLRSAANDALAALGIKAEEVADFALPSSEQHYEFVVEHLSAEAAPASASSQWLIGREPPADAEEVHAAFHSVRSRFSDDSQVRFPVEVSTPDEPWAYGAWFRLSVPHPTGPIWLRVLMDVDSGPVGVGILNHDEEDFLSRQAVTQQGAVTVNLHVLHPELMGHLVVQSWEKGKSAKVTIKDIVILKPREVSQPGAADSFAKH